MTIVGLIYMNIVTEFCTILQIKSLIERSNIAREK